MYLKYSILRSGKNQSQADNEMRYFRCRKYCWTDSVWVGLCKLDNKILKKAKNAEKSHF